MGGLFRTPKLAAPDDSAAAAAQAAEAAEGEARRRTLERTRRGLAGTIATSGRGVLAPLPSALAAARKSLLGE
jgi:hypothetical protein